MGRFRATNSIHLDLPSASFSVCDLLKSASGFPSNWTEKNKAAKRKSAHVNIMQDIQQL